MSDISLQLAPAFIGTPDYRDLLMVDGSLTLTADADSRGANPITQSLVQRLRTLAGEYFLNTSLGLPYFGQLFGQKAISSDFEAALQNVVLGTPGILSLLSWSAESNTITRTLIVSFRAQSTAGEINWAGDVALAS